MSIIKKNNLLFLDEKSNKMCAKKGIFPYDYLKTDKDYSTIEDILSETELPRKNEFYNILK